MKKKFGTVVKMPNGLSEKICAESALSLNKLLADTLTLRDLYKKHHWQTSGPTFYQLHLLFDTHFNQQAELADDIAEHIQALGGVSIAMGYDVAELTTIARAPKDTEDANSQIARLIDAHELILKEARSATKKAEERGDYGTNDLLVSSIVRINEKQLWFLVELVT